MTVVVTGGTKVIGFEVAKAFASKGEKIVINYFNDDKTAQESRDRIIALGCREYFGFYCKLIANRGTVVSSRYFRG